MTSAASKTRKGSVKGDTDEGSSVIISPAELETVVQRAVEAAAKEIRQLLNEKLERLETKTAELEGRITALEQQLADNGVSELSSRVNTMASQAELQAIRAESRESLLQSNDNEQYARRNNIRIFGLQSGEDCRSASVNFIRSALRISDIEAEDIEVAHSVQTSSSRRPAVLVQFRHREHRDKVIRARKALKGSKYAITEDLTSLNLKTMNRLKNSEYVQNTWSWNGKLFAILTNGKKVQVRPFQSVNELL